MSDISGKNIVNKIDFQMLAKEFSEFFFLCWKSAKIEISNILEEYTRLKYKNTIYKGKQEIITLLFSRRILTSAIFLEGRFDVPENITSSIPLPLRLFAEVSPIHHLKASTIFDFPQPFGPTIPVRPSSINK